MKTVIFGDIHGCFDALKSLFEKTGAEGADRIVFLGDYIDRGPKVFETLEFVSELKKGRPEEVILILGNHEDMMINRDDCWDSNGNEYTRRSLRLNGSSVHEWGNYFEKEGVLYYEGEGFGCCHAEADRELSECERNMLLWGSNKTSPASGTGKLLVAGHRPVKTPTLYSENGVTEFEYEKEYPLPEKGLLDVDTGAVFGRFLTAAVIENGKIRFERN